MLGLGIGLVLLVILGLLVLVIGWGVLTYNALVGLRNQLQTAWAQIDVQLKRRYDLIPNLVETVKGYAKHERELLERLASARARAAANHGPVASQEADERPVVASLRRVLALQESYPELKADRNFLALQEELVDTEDRIAAARRFFNGNVRDFNSRCQSIPSSIVASLFGFRPESFWEVDEASQRERPRVSY